MLFPKRKCLLNTTIQQKWKTMSYLSSSSEFWKAHAMSNYINYLCIRFLVFRLVQFVSNLQSGLSAEIARQNVRVVSLSKI
jgi:hypothetical protein